MSGDWRNEAEVEAPPVNLCAVRTGSVIPATLISGINSDLPGQIMGQVYQDVYVAPTGKYLYFFHPGSPNFSESTGVFLIGNARA